MDLQDIKRIGQAAIARHGEAKQVMMAVEECGELLTSLSQHSRGRVPSAAVVEEAADGNRLGGGMGSGLHAEKWPALTPGARSTLAEHVTWLEQALAELEAAQQWRPMETAPRDGSAIQVASTGGDVEQAHWYAGAWFVYFPDAWLSERDCVGWLPLPEPPKETP